MNEPNFSVVKDSQFLLSQLEEALQKPTIFTPGDAPFWNDPYISQQMLSVHLDPTTDLASRRPEVIDATVAWLIEQPGLHPGQTILDLGCGPGLYCTRFAEHGLIVTGVDYSQTSIEYARSIAQKRGLEITYLCQNYFSLEIQNTFHALLMIWCDFGVLSDVQRDSLLDILHKKLKPGGLFAFDVWTPQQAKHELRGTAWSIEQKGLWRPGPHLILEAGFEYPDQNVSLHEYAVIDEHGEAATYRMWTHHYTPDAITQILEEHGFVVKDIKADLMGSPYTSESTCLGVIAQKR
jgi:cyclopropane fatty-acyl-phospholipid synthase-like methyltransferase